MIIIIIRIAEQNRLALRRRKNRRPARAICGLCPSLLPLRAYPPIGEKNRSSRLRRARRRVRRRFRDRGRGRERVGEAGPVVEGHAVDELLDEAEVVLDEEQLVEEHDVRVVQQREEKALPLQVEIALLLERGVGDLHRRAVPGHPVEPLVHAAVRAGAEQPRDLVVADGAEGQGVAGGRLSFVIKKDGRGGEGRGGSAEFLFLLFFAFRWES